MPCNDGGYRDAEEESMLRSRNDKLARINCTLLRELEALGDGTVEALILKDEELADWWREHKEQDRLRKAKEEKERKAAAEKARLEKIKEDLLSKLTADQIKALGIR